MTPEPPFTDPARVVEALRTDGDALLGPSDVFALTGCEGAQLDALRASWDSLAPDNFLKDGGCYRHRRHACFVYENTILTRTAHRAHWQPLEYNALHGGMHRLFEPVLTDAASRPAWTRLLVALCDLCSALKGTQPCCAV